MTSYNLLKNASYFLFSLLEKLRSELIFVYFKIKKIVSKINKIGFGGFSFTVRNWVDLLGCRISLLGDWQMEVALAERVVYF